MMMNSSSMYKFATKRECYENQGEECENMVLLTPLDLSVICVIHMNCPCLVLLWTIGWDRRPGFNLFEIFLLPCLGGEALT